MKRFCFVLMAFTIFFIGCQTVPQTVYYTRDDDRASYTPGTLFVPTNTQLPSDFTTSTPTDDRGSATPCDIDGCPRPTATSLPSDWPTSTLNPDQIYLTQLAQTIQPTIDISAQQTHEAGGN